MKTNKYMREIKPGVFVDVYDVLNAFKTGSAAVDHAVKKLLAPGKRGVKSREQDLNEAIASIRRAVEIEEQKPTEIGEFECPECGSNRFGTSNCLAKNPADMIGHCHGAGCRFTWSRADDEKYFSERGAQ